MARDHIFVGLEIGTTKVCVVVAEARQDNTLKILGVGNAPSRGIRKGELVDFETAKRCVHDAIVDAEERSDVEISEVYLGISGGHIRSFHNPGIVLLEKGAQKIEEPDPRDVRTQSTKWGLPLGGSGPRTITHHSHLYWH